MNSIANMRKISLNPKKSAGKLGVGKVVSVHDLDVTENLEVSWVGGQDDVSSGNVLTVVKIESDTSSASKSETSQELSELLFEEMKHHQVNSLNSFDLVASNSFVSNAVRKVMSSTLMNSYCIGTPGSRFYGGCAEIDKIENMTKEVICQMFNCDYCEVQLLSGMLANIAAYKAMLPETGAVVMASPAKHGGHYSHNRGGALTSFFGAKVVMTPWLSDTYNVDIKKLDEAMGKHKPHLLIIGWSEMLFEHDLPTIRKVCDDHGCKILYDMSHVAGLIAGGVFQQDMMTYADIVTSSTGKSLHSADHGMILYNDPSLTAKIREAVMPILTSNTHFHETAALGMTLLEWQSFGNGYAKQVVANTKALGKAFAKRGFKVLCESRGFSETHEIILSLELDGKVIASGPEATRILDKVNIRVNPQELPTDTAESGATGLRLGTQVLTRRGFKESDMALVAGAIHEALVVSNGKSNRKAICNKVATVAGRFKSVHYSFDGEVTEPPTLRNNERSTKTLRATKGRLRKFLRM